MKLSTRPEKRVGDDALWDLAEKSLADALDAQVWLGISTW
jgi:threonyl-tRNA synthetase